MRLVRILRSTVMVRVGGGWVALDEFLVKNDPCRGKWPEHSILLIMFRQQNIYNFKTQIEDAKIVISAVEMVI